MEILDKNMDFFTNGYHVTKKMYIFAVETPRGASSYPKNLLEFNLQKLPYYSLRRILSLTNPKKT